MTIYDALVYDVARLSSIFSIVPRASNPVQSQHRNFIDEPHLNKESLFRRNVLTVRAMLASYLLIYFNLRHLNIFCFYVLL